MIKNPEDIIKDGPSPPDLLRAFPSAIKPYIESGITIGSDGSRDYYARDGKNPFFGEKFIDIDPYDPSRMEDLLHQSTGISFAEFEDAKKHERDLTALQSARIERLGLTPERVLAGEVDDSRFSYFEIMWYQKLCSICARDGATTGMSQEHVDFFRKKSFQILLKGLSDHLPFSDLLLAEILEGAFRDGLVEKFPKEIEDLLRLGILKGQRYEFFDTFYKFKKSRGEMSDVIKFVYDNIDVLIKMNLWLSSCFQELIADPSQDGQKMRLMHLKHTYLQRKTFMDKIAYFFIVLLCASGNYREAEKVLKEIEIDASRKLSDYAGKRAKVLQLMEAVETVSGRTAELTQDNTDRVRRIILTAKDAFSALIPPFCLEGFTGNDLKTENHPDDPSRSPADTQKVTRRAVSLLNVSREIMVAASQGVEQTIAVLKKASEDSCVEFSDFYETVKNALMCFADVPENRDFEGLLEALKREEIPVPQEVLNVCTARVCERRFQKQDYEGVIACYEAECTNPNAVLLRGSAYYAMRSYFEIAEEGDVNIGKGITAICTLLPQFQGTEWEEEIWECYVLPHYLKYRELINGLSGTVLEMPIMIMRRQVSAEPAVVENHVKLLLLLMRRWAKKFPMPEYYAFMDVLPDSSPDDAIAEVLPDLNKGAVSHLCSSGRLKEASDLIARIPHYEADAYLRQKRFDLLLHASIRTAETIDEAERLAEACAIENFEARVIDAKSALGINTCRNGTYLSVFESLARDEEKTHKMFGSKSGRQVFLTREMHRMIDSYGSLFRDDFFRDFLRDSAGAEFEVRSGVLRRCGVRTVSFKVQKKNISIHLTICEDEKKRLYNRVEFIMDKDFNLTSPSDLYSFSSLERRLYYLLFQAGLMEEISNICMGASSDDCDKIFAPESSDWKSFLDRFKDFSYSSDLFGEEDVRRVAEANLDTVKILEEYVTPSRMALLSSYGVEFDGLSGLYRELIDKFRDIDDSDFCYRSRIDSSNPVSACGCAKFTAFYDSFQGAEILQRQGVPTEVVHRLGLPKAEKNNLAGYAEVVFFFPRYGEKKVSLVLDKAGNAVIFGINPDHPLYKALQCAVLESLALRVVPELKPLSTIFSPNQGGRSKMSVFFKADNALRMLSPLDEEARVATRKRAAICSAVVGKHKRTVTEPQDKLEILEDVYRLFFQLELSDRDLSRWPLFFRGKDCVFHRVDGLFVCKEGGNFVDTGVLRKICPVDFCEGGEQIVAVEALPKEVFEFLQKQIRVQTLRGRGYNLPVEIEKPLHRMECIEGIHYYLIPAGNRRGKTVTRDGQLFRLKEAEPFETIIINGETYFASSWQRSEKNERAYDKFATIKIEFVPRRFLYAVLYDPSSGKIVSTTSIGLADKDEHGDYLDKRSALCRKIHGGGGFGAFVDSKLKKKLGEIDMCNLREELVEIPVNVGYRQGRFPSLGRYLSSKERTRKLVIATILREMEGNLSPEEHEALKRMLETPGEKAGVGEKVDVGAGVDEGTETEMIKPKDEDAQKSTRAAITDVMMGKDNGEKKESGDTVYRVSRSKGPYGGLHNMDLKLFPVDDPEYSDLKEIFRLKPDEVLVIIVPEVGARRPSKVRRSLLVKKRKL